MENFGSHIYSFNSSPRKDATIDVTFVIHDFEQSKKGQVITEEVCNENLQTLVNKPILTKYYEQEDEDTPDHLGDHEVYLTANRDTGDLMITTDTVAIGVCTKAYIGEAEGKRCLLADGILWSDRYYNACSLLYEWYMKGIRTMSSCEYLYSNYEVKDGIQYIKSDIVYEGITILNSEVRGDADIVPPAYESSHMLNFSFNQALCEDINTINQLVSTNTVKGDEQVEEVTKEVEAVVEPTKELNEEHVEPIIETVETQVQEETLETVEATEEIQGEEAQEEVQEEPIVETIELSKYKELEEELVQVKAELEAEKKAKCQLSEEIVSLNTTISELGVYKEQYDKEQYEVALNAKKEYYKEKFEKFGAMELFNSEEVQELIEKCLNAEQEVEARLALSEMLINMDASFNSAPKESVAKPVVEFATPMKDLVPKNKFKENYGFEK